jgi:RNA polymerase sigma-70 factor (ECF subfamily)
VIRIGPAHDEIAVVRQEAWSEPHGRSLPEAAGVVADPLAEVARSAARGDAQAQRRLFEAIAPALLPPLRMILGPQHPDLEDALQEALLGLLRGLAGFRGESSVLHYARRVAVKRAIEVRRREHTTARKIEHSREVHVPAPPTPGENAVAARRREHLRELLEELPGAQAEALAMKVVLGHSLEEIAEAAGVPVNTVRSRLRLAKEALRRRIDTDPSLGELLQETS